MNKAGFAGPLFIIGTTRSGTKLLRDLLNRNPMIGIPIVETGGFIPQMVRHFGNPPRFAQDANGFDEFFRALTQTTFFWYMEREGRVLTKEHFKQEELGISWSSIFEFVLRFYAPIGKERGFIWGDKTPGQSHINDMTLLKTIFPTARFLHIVRDPRDVCLSVKKTWGKSIYRAATRWREEIETARSTSREFSEDYKEVSYEALLQDPKQVLRSVCEFLECEFCPSMTTLKEPSEQVGDAKGQVCIMQDNIQKYRSRLSPLQVQRIEEIAYPTMLTTGYEREYAHEFKPLSHLQLMLLTGYDASAILWFDVRDRGLLETLRFLANRVRSYCGVLYKRS